MFGALVFMRTVLIDDIADIAAAAAWRLDARYAEGVFKNAASDGYVFNAAAHFASDGNAEAACETAVFNQNILGGKTAPAPLGISAAFDGNAIILTSDQTILHFYSGTGIKIQAISVKHMTLIAILVIFCIDLYVLDSNIVAVDQMQAPSGRLTDRNSADHNALCVSEANGSAAFAGVFASLGLVKRHAAAVNYAFAEDADVFMRRAVRVDQACIA